MPRYPPRIVQLPLRLLKAMTEDLPAVDQPVAPPASLSNGGGHGAEFVDNRLNLLH